MLRKRETFQAAMRRTLLLLLAPAAAFAQNVSIGTLRATGLPLVIVETVDGEEPTCEYLTTGGGYPGNTIRNATKVPGRILVVEREDTLFDSGEYAEGAGGMTVRMRGNTSAFRRKHPFKVKLQAKGDMLCRDGGKRYLDRDWLLLDGSTMNMMTGMAVSRLVGLQWTPAFRYVNLLFNGEYRGTYILSESVKRNPSCRLDVDKEEGFIIEKDAYWWNQDVYFQGLAPSWRFTFKYPDPDGITAEQVAYARQRITQWEQSVADGTYDEHIDVASFAAWLLAHDILGDWDAGGSNLFLTCYDHGAKMRMGNIWDLDDSYRRKDQWARVHEWWDFPFEKMLNSSNRSFLLAYLAKWEEVSSTLFAQLDAELSDYLLSSDCAALESSRRAENDSLGFQFPTIAEDLGNARQWFSSREVWLADTIQRMKDDCAIATLTVGVGTRRKAAPAYDLQGRRRSTVPQRSMYVRNGRKYVVR